jgi:hypothetical protein
MTSYIVVIAMSTRHYHDRHDDVPQKKTSLNYANITIYGVTGANSHAELVTIRVLTSTKYKTSNAHHHHV